MFLDIDTEEFFINLENCVLATDGQGLWSCKQSDVRCTQIVLDISQHGEDVWGEIRLIFDQATWDVHVDGLIYTDCEFETSFRCYLQNNLGFSADAAYDLGYSEQGMQGSDYVSFDCGKKFIEEFVEKFGQ